MSDTVQPNDAPPNVIITFDGLFLFRLDRAGQVCEIKVHTAAPGHVMKIRVKSAGQDIRPRKVFSSDSLITMAPLRLFVGEGSGFPSTLPSVTDVDGGYNKILNLAGANFYPGGRTIKSGMYGSSIMLNNGTFVEGADDDCKRVKHGLFPMLHFKWLEADWEDFQRAVRLFDPAAIKDLYPTIGKFAKEVKIHLNLAPTQALRLVDKNNTNIFDPLTYGPDYEVRIDYADVDLPTSLGDCKGFAHHSEALDIGGEPVYGIFKPIFVKAGDSNSSTTTLTDAGCCECGRMDYP